MNGWRLQRRSLRSGVVVCVVIAATVLLGADAIAPEDVRRPGAKDTLPSEANDRRQLPGSPDPLAGGLVGSKHDFTQSGAHPRQLCLPCHTPHIPRSSAPLLDDRPAATQPAPLYRDVGAELDSTSLLCLGCHDGVIAPATDARSDAPRATHQLGSRKLDMGSLASHPVGVKYPAADPRYNSIPAVTADGRVRLRDGRVQCTSCHDPHNTERHPKMLVKSNENGQLCLSCHRFQ
jgi:predicted CXXCH cytochrome family protein